MSKKEMIFIIIGILCSVGLMFFLYNWYDNFFSTYNYVEYSGTIQRENNIVLQNSFSWYMSFSMSWDYNIYHNIDIKEDKNDIIKLSIVQQKNKWIENNILKDYWTKTDQWNHWLSIFTQEILKKHKNNTIPSFSQISWLVYYINKTEWLLVDKITITGTQINQLAQKNNYYIIINSNCGISQYFTKKWRCDIYGKIQLDLPIDKYTKERILKWILYKSKK